MSDGFDMKELDAFTKDLLNLASDKLPKQTKQFLKTEGKKLSKKNKSVYISKGIGEVTGNLKASFKAGKVYKYGDDLAIRAYTSSPHAHLLDKGWIHKAPDGSEKFIVGFDFLEDAKNAFTSEYYKDVDNWLDKMLDEEGL
jgi:hypothetical protein